MIYRVSGDDLRPWVEVDFDLSFGKWPFLAEFDIKPYADVWKTAHIQFKSPEGDDTNEYSDITERGGKLFLSEKAYDTLKDTFNGHGEFLPVTFNAGTGYIFNPLENIAPIEGSVLAGEHGASVPSAYAFDEAGLPPIFRTEIDSKSLFITKDVYRMIRLNGLNGLLFYKDYSNTYAEPEGGYKGSTSMPGYEDED